MSVSPTPLLLHVNPHCLLASLRELQEPELRGQAFVIGTPGAVRGQVLSVSEAALQAGLHPGMELRLCGSVPVHPPDHVGMARISAVMGAVCETFTPLVELQEKGHIYMELRGTRRLFGAPIRCAALVRERIFDSTGIVPSVCIASSKIAAKIGTRICGPGGLVFIPPDQTREFLAPQGVEVLAGFDPRQVDRLHRLGLRTLGDLAGLEAEEAAKVLGPWGITLRERALGIDHDPVRPESSLDPAIRGEEIFPEDLNEPDLLRSAVLVLAAGMGFTLRSRRLASGQADLTFLYSDGRTGTASHRQSQATNLESGLMEIVDLLLDRMPPRRVRIRKVSLSFGRLKAAGQQGFLFKSRTQDRLERLQTALDASRNRFGIQAVQAGSCLGKRTAP